MFLTVLLFNPTLLITLTQSRADRLQTFANFAASIGPMGVPADLELEVQRCLDQDAKDIIVEGEAWPQLSPHSPPAVCFG